MKVFLTCQPLHIVVVIATPIIPLNMEYEGLSQYNIYNGQAYMRIVLILP